MLEISKNGLIAKEAKTQSDAEFSVLEIFKNSLIEEAQAKVEAQVEAEVQAETEAEAERESKEDLTLRTADDIEKFLFSMGWTKLTKPNQKKAGIQSPHGGGKAGDEKESNKEEPPDTDLSIKKVSVMVQVEK